MPTPNSRPAPPADTATDTGGGHRPGRPGGPAGLIAAGACLIAGLCLLLIAVPGALRDLRDFRAAPGCAAGAQDAGRAGEDCRWTTGARIDHFRRDSTPKGGPRYWWYFVEQDGSRTKARIPGTPSELPGIHPGSHLKVTYWRGKIRYVDYGTRRRYTRDDPHDAFGPYLGFGLGLTTFGAAAAPAALFQRRRSPRGARGYPWQSVLLLGGCLLAVPGGTLAAFSGSVGSGLKAYGAVAAVAAVCCAVALLITRLRRPTDDTLAMAAAAPAGEQHFRGSIRGEVPYAGKGGTLVVAPGYLASTVDPTGVSYRHEVPATLTPGRVRRTHWTDQDAGGTRGLVTLECVDGGAPVLILTDPRNMPLILGALNGRPAPASPAP